VTAVPLVFAVAAAAFAAASLRLRSLVATALAAYLALVAQAGGVTWALSPFDAVTRTGLTAAEGAVLAAAAGAWWLRGRPVPSAAAARSELRDALGDRLTALFLAVLLAALAYELVLALTVPPNTWDALTYHLSRVAAWQQAHGVHWIANAPTGRMNEFQPLAEQQILFLVVAAGTTALYALPQYVAQLAVLAAVYGTARRLGYETRAAARGTALVATLSLVALEATTAQNDLVAAALPVAAAFFLLGGVAVEEVLAGAAVAFGIGVKLTTSLALPALAWLAWRAGRRAAPRAALGAAAGRVVAGGWGYVLNLEHTGHVLGHGQGRVENTASLSLANDGGTLLRLVYRLLDLSVTPWWLTALLAAAGGAVLLAAALRRSPAAAWAALPLLVPLAVLAVLEVVDRDPENIPRAANEDFSSFGPVGTAVLFASPVAAFVSVRRRGADPRRLALALALPGFLVLLALTAKYNVWITRFLVVPAVLAAPLFAGLVRARGVALSLLALGTLTVALALGGDANKKLFGSVGQPWTLSQADALAEFSAEPTGEIVAGALRAYDRAVPADACVGAVLDPDEPAYLLWGGDLRRRVFFLPSLAAVETADRLDLAYVVVSTGVNAPVAGRFADAGWRVERLGGYWQLAVAPAGKAGSLRTEC
jgi:hypothetical protein